MPMTNHSCSTVLYFYIPRETGFASAYIRATRICGVRNCLIGFWKKEVNEELIKVLQKKQIPFRARVQRLGHYPQLTQPWGVEGTEIQCPHGSYPSSSHGINATTIRHCNSV